MHFANSIDIDRPVGDEFEGAGLDGVIAKLDGTYQPDKRVMFKLKHRRTPVTYAVAEPRRRQILDVLAERERPVNDLVEELGLAQPAVSRHLRVLREVGLVDVREQGRQRIYRLNGRSLRPIHDWVKRYEDAWNERLDRLDAVVQELKEKEEKDGGRDE